MMLNFLHANWPAPKSIIAGTTTKSGGFSSFPYESFNLAAHVNDDFDDVVKNRKLLMSELALPHAPEWLNQVHGTRVVDLKNVNNSKSTDNCADAIISFESNKVCAILTADCLPLLITDTTSTRIAAIHAGWRGLRDGIIEKTVSSLNCAPEKLLVWIGPAISGSVFEVDDTVRDEFVNIDTCANLAYTATTKGHWLMDLVLLARQRLIKSGIKEETIYGGDRCSYLEQDLFYSFRRRNITGRMASLIYIRKS